MLSYLILVLIPDILIKLLVPTNPPILNLGVLRQPGCVVGADRDGSVEVPCIDRHVSGPTAKCLLNTEIAG